MLIGYRGSGKTVVGRLLAERRGWTFVDTDALIEAQAGISIAEIFAAEGEAGFRAREERVIARVAADRRRVLSVGGGAVLRQENVAQLREALNHVRRVWDDKEKQSTEN